MIIFRNKYFADWAKYLPVRALSSPLVAAKLPVSPAAIKMIALVEAQ